jgi:peptide/nickel transport system substrate-binding protein
MTKVWRRGAAAAGALTAVILLFFSPAFIPYSPAATLADWEKSRASGLDALLSQTEYKPYNGEDYVPGRVAGSWNSSVTSDPKSFNLLVAERDGSTAAIVGALHDALVDYHTVKREWYPRLAYFEVQTVGDKLDVIYTLRENLSWSFYGSDRKVPVTSDDVVFWYNDIVGDPEFESSGYNGQFLTMEDGSMAHIDIEKLDDRRFVFHFPRVIAEPLLHTNMEFGPAFLYREAKEKGGVEGVLDILGIDTDPKLIPSVGQWFLADYVPGLRLRYVRNPDHWERSVENAAASPSLPLKEETMVQILSDANTQFLVFKSGDLDSYAARTEDLDDLIFQKNRNYTVYNAEGALSASFWSFNQNPVNKDRPQYAWFTRKEFRQAMSCILNRDRIIAQVYGGLAEPKLNFFPEPNPFYNKDIVLPYTYNPEKALRLLESIGIKRDAKGIMRDSEGRSVEFDLSIPEGVSVYVDIAFIIADEAEKIGIKINIRALDFQKIVEQLTRSYDWSSVFLAFGAPLWPTQGSNVWPSTGNLHLWHPLQKTPATEWEARIDWLYNEGSYTIDKDNARAYWDEYQRILLEQCPIIYLVRPRSFYALHNRWDAANFYYDNMRGADVDRVFLRP